ncbi:MAG: UPF0175 family protein [bacterium]
MLKVKDFVKSGLYKDENEVIQDALRHLIQIHPDFKIKLAIDRYKRESISVGKAANIAGVSLEQMKDILISNGIQPRLGPETIEEAEDEVTTLRKVLDGSNN